MTPSAAECAIRSTHRCAACSALERSFQLKCANPRMPAKYGPHRPPIPTMMCATAPSMGCQIAPRNGANLAASRCQFGRLWVCWSTQWGTFLLWWVRFLLVGGYASVGAWW
jgi:hypothetical protein